MTKVNTIKFGVLLDRCHFYRDSEGQDKSYVDWDTVVQKSVLCDNLGYDILYQCDHLFWPPTGTTGPCAMMELYTTKAAIAQATKRAQLCETVTAVGIRNPALVARMEAQIDFISHGRTMLGIGAGWADLEFKTYNIPFPKPAVRIAQMREAIQICKLMWTDKAPVYEGKYFRIKGAVCEPKPVQKPRPRIMVGGAGEQLTLKVVAQEADEWNIGGVKSIEMLKHKMDVLRKHCEAVGRNYDDIVKQINATAIIYKNKDELRRIVTRTPGLPQTQGLWPLTKEFDDQHLLGTTDEIIDKIQQRIDIGVTTFNIYPRAGTDEQIELFYDKVVKHFK
jgi:alkanesulfonate monooxygenase SsuD/methylene tetrahydromethanopterin reductase-like flavin-dependent oxidoreductase (luciferase family)